MMKKTLTFLAIALLCSSLSQAAIVYVDADGTNTTNTTNWNFRSLANNNNVYESQGSSGAEMVTTITGLTASTEYNVYGFYWGSDDPDTWRVDLGTVSGSLTTYDESGTFASTLDYVTDPLFVEGNRTMYAASLGTITANASGEIAVYIDDSTTTNNFTRAWYDGVGYSPVPEPSAFALLGGMLALTWVMLRRRSA